MTTKTKIIIVSIVTTIVITATLILNLSCKTNQLPVVVSPQNSSEVNVAPTNSIETSTEAVATTQATQISSPTQITQVNISPAVDLNNCEAIKSACNKCKLGF